ncbi:uncharacterized protein [Haliotis asinina]|uniref:uncharacterized protein n=1 Tax=Haliotis asinina TaxID=109174 RepID=UPI0035320FEB
MAKHLLRSTARHKMSCIQIILRSHHEAVKIPLYPHSLKLKDVSISGVGTRAMCTSSLPSSWYHKYQFQQKSVLDGATDIECTVSVIDTHHGATDKPIVLGIHGLLGQGEDFEPLISKLHKRGIRVVAPTFPGFQGSSLEPWQLNHLDFTTQGRALILKIILDTVGIHRVDMLLTHSAGSWLCYKLLAEWDIFRSAGFLSPVGVNPHRIIRPHFTVKAMSTLLRVQTLQPVTLSLISRLYRSLGFAGAQAGTDVAASQHLLAGPEFHNIPNHVEEIRRKKIPLFIAHTIKDKIVELEIPLEVITKHLLIPQQNIVHYDDNSVPSKDPFQGFIDDWLVRVLFFERGGHIVHRPHCDIIIEQIMSILQHINHTSS